MTGLIENVLFEKADKFCFPKLERKDGWFKFLRTFKAAKISVSRRTFSSACKINLRKICMKTTTRTKEWLLLKNF